VGGRPRHRIGQHSPRASMPSSRFAFLAASLLLAIAGPTQAQSPQPLPAAVPLRFDSWRQLYPSIAVANRPPVSSSGPRGIEHAMPSSAVPSGPRPVWSFAPRSLRSPTTRPTAGCPSARLTATSLLEERASPSDSQLDGGLTACPTERPVAPA